MQSYNRLLEDILSFGEERQDRTGVGTISSFSHNLRFDLTQGFPLITCKKMHWKSIVGELLWFISGSTSIKPLQRQGITIWDEWADANGYVGPMYGKQFRDSNNIDQLAETIERINIDPQSRRHVISLWNVSQLDKMALPPCHGIAIQFYVRNNKYLNLAMYQRSCDMFLGVPFNIASYSLLLHIVAAQTKYKPGIFNWHGGDCHIYKNHMDQVRLQISRDPFPLATLDMPKRHLDGYSIDDFILINYKSHSSISGEVAV